MSITSIAMTWNSPLWQFDSLIADLQGDEENTKNMCYTFNIYDGNAFDISIGI